MKKRLLTIAVFALALATLPVQAAALEAYAIKEASGPSTELVTGSCPLAANLNGTCGNVKYYNICSGYIWYFSGIPTGDAFGTRFDGACVSPGHRVKRGITYYRATVPNYHQTVDVYLDRDTNNDGCPNGVICSDLGLDPGERWNCSNFDCCVPVSAGQSLILRSVKGGSSAPTWATDGPYTSVCDPNGQDRSYYYPVGTSSCLPWRINSPTGRGDNFLSYLVIDNYPAGCACCGPDATEPTSWGHIKGLFQ